MYVWLCRKNTTKAKFCVTVLFSLMIFLILFYAIEDHRRSKSKKYIPNCELNRSMRGASPTTEMDKRGHKNRTLHESSTVSETMMRPSLKPFGTRATTRQSKVNSTTHHKAFPTFKQLYQPGFEVALPGLCPGNGTLVKVVIIIISKPSNTKDRSDLRKTVRYFKAARNFNIPIAFMLGQSRHPKTAQSVRKESLLYKDIIINHNYENYKNLSLKTLSTFEWFQSFCSKASYILKVDDDMLINADNLYKFVTKRIDSSNVIYGRMSHNGHIVARHRLHVYYVPSSVYPGKYWPPFIYGAEYLLTSDVPATLYKAALNNTFVAVEDAFFTGVLAAQEGVRLVHSPDFWGIKASLENKKHLGDAVAYYRDIPEPRT